MSLFICAAGTSVLGGPPRPAEFPTLTEQIEARIARERAAAAGNREAFLVRASAETNGLCRAGAGPDDRVVFLASDTEEGQAAARRLVALTEAEFGCHAGLRIIRGLQMTDGRRFQREAIDALFTVLDTLIQGEPPGQVSINATGGFKGTLPYLVLYGMVEGIDVLYVYEWSNALIRLPPLPVRFDWARLAGAAAAVFAIADAAAIPEKDWRTLLPSDYHEREAEYNALFLFEDGLVGLSGPGFLVKRSLEASQASARILLSREASAALAAADATVRRKFETILSRARNPLARRSGRHTERLTNVGSDLMVWKTVGPNAPRMLYWEDGDDVRVAELRLHDDYDAFWQRGARSRADYASAAFVEWGDRTPPDYADLAAAANTVDLADPAASAALRAELARARAEGDAARGRLNQATRQARHEGMEHGRAEARSQARSEIDRARREAAEAGRLAAAAEARLAALEASAAPELVELRRRNLDLERYVAALEDLLGQANGPGA